MKRIEAYWTAIGTVGLEHLVLREAQERIVADGLVLRYHNGQGLRVGYQITCDTNWSTRQVAVQLSGSDAAEVRMSTDGRGKWSGPGGEPLEQLAGCLDVDVMATPFTNTLPIRRLGLRVGASREIEVAYVRIPDLQLSRSRQRYTCMERVTGRALYLFESLDSDFKAELAVDGQGMILDYQNIWVRTV